MGVTGEELVGLWGSDGVRLLFAEEVSAVTLPLEARQFMCETGIPRTADNFFEAIETPYAVTGPDNSTCLYIGRGWYSSYTFLVDNSGSVIATVTRTDGSLQVTQVNSSVALFVEFLFLVNMYLADTDLASEDLHLRSRS
jgi:SUKH-4 immunity protein